MSDFNEKCKEYLIELEKKERKYNILTQTIEDFKKPEFIRVERNDFHKYKSNNWLKMHGKPMRRKPFKKLCQPILIMDEAWMAASL